VQRSQVASRIGEWQDAVKQRVGEAYQWLLVPSAAPAEPAVSWEVTRAGGSDPLAVRASRKLRSEEALIAGYSGARLRMDLDRVPLWREDHLALRDLWAYYAQYLYLPRLRDVGVLLEAVADGVGRLDWAQDGFAFAESWDESAGRYAGLRGGEQIALADPRGLVVKPEGATAQLERERSVEADVRADGEDAGGRGASRSGTAAEAEPGQRDAAADAVAAAPRRFFGQVELAPLRVPRDAGQVAEAIVGHLSALMGSDVTVRLEIEANVPNGVPDDVVRTVSENARTLKFTDHGFEDD
jgi:hypothetical protein